MKNFVLTILLFVVSSVVVLAQNGLTFSNEVGSSKDRSVVKIQDRWSEYFAACRELSADKIDSLRSVYWHEDETADLVGSSISAKFPLYKLGNHHTFSIRKLDETLYEINTMVSVGKNNNELFCIYKVCFSDGKFTNYFTVSSVGLKQKRVGNIVYYMSHNLNFDSGKADSISKFIENFAKNYDIGQLQPIRYVVGNSIDECQTFMGFPYTVARSESKSAGMAIHPDIIISCRQDHIHEIVHRLMRSNENGALAMLHEGIATYYGGTGELNIEQHIELLGKYIENKGRLNLADFDSYNELLENGSNPYYTVGFLIIEEALRCGGEQKVKRMFTYESMEEVFEHEFSTSKDKIDTYIRELINNRE